MTTIMIKIVWKQSLTYLFIGLYVWLNHRHHFSTFKQDTRKSSVGLLFSYSNHWYRKSVSWNSIFKFDIQQLGLHVIQDINKKTFKNTEKYHGQIWLETLYLLQTECLKKKFCQFNSQHRIFYSNKFVKMKMWIKIETRPFFMCLNFAKLLNLFELRIWLTSKIR